MAHRANTFGAVVKPRDTHFLRPALPRQAISFSKKDDRWREENIDAIQSLGNVTVLNGRTSRHRKQINYNLVNSIFDPTDFKYVTDPYNVGAELGNQPAELRDFNLIANKLNVLKGEEWETGFEFEAIGINGEVIPAIAEARKNVLLQATFDKLRFELDTLKGEKPNTSPPEIKQIANNFNRTYRDIREKNANHVLRFLLHKDKLRHKFNEGFEHALVSSEEVYYVGIGPGGNPTVRTVNPLNFDFDKNPDTHTIEDADWAREDQWLSPSKIIDHYREWLSDLDIERIETGDLGAGFSTSYYYPGYIYTPADFRINLVNSTRERGGTQSNHILVTNCVWKSRKHIGFVTEVTPDGEVIETVVDEAFSLTDEQKDSGVTIEWQWINEVWGGTKIGSDLYVNINPLPNQIRSIDDPSECKLPYVGRVYNNLNATATSMVELMKPHQYLYNIVWYRLENELAKAKGKAFIMDLAQIPKSHGIELTEWMYYFETAGIAFINSMEEGTDIFSGEKPSFNQFKDIDRSLSQVVGQYILILNKIEELLDNITGITPQRAAQVGKSETATGVRTAVTQSSAITAPLFQTHNSVVEQVLTQLLETSKVAYSDGKKAAFVLDEIYRVSIDVDGAIFNDSDYGVFVTNSVRNRAIRQKIEAIGEVAVQSNQADLKDLIRLYKSTSTAEMEGILEESQLKKQQEALELQDAERQALLAVEQEKASLEIEKENRMDARNIVDSETDIAVARIQALAKLGSIDTNKNSVLDVLEVERQGIEKMKIASAERIKALDVAQKDRSDKTKLAIARENKNRFDTKNKK